MRQTVARLTDAFSVPMLVVRVINCEHRPVPPDPAGPSLPAKLERQFDLIAGNHSALISTADPDVREDAPSAYLRRLLG
jgi:hypothetical protein